MLAAAFLSAAGSLVSGMAQYQASNYQAAIAEANSKIAKENAKQAWEIGQRDAIDLGTENAGLAGEQVSAQSASGLSLNSGSSQRARYRQRELGYEEQVRRVEAAQKQHANYKTEANIYKAEAASHRSAAGFALAGAAIGAAGSLAGAAQPTSGGSSRFGIPVPTARPRWY
ncbi:MAG: hypothetical protein KDA17_00985 [Candidatus Saccharibacteria bacterium]|nr:hypothetical protein [Candidatus Saccharibacteria bacterium]